jgi:hypothetical protein
MGKIEVKKFVGEIIDSLCNDKGFEKWWYGLDDEVEMEIISDLEKIIKKRLENINYQK